MLKRLILNISDIKRFWKIVKPSLSEKFNAKQRVSLKTEKRRVEVFNNFFGNVTKSLCMVEFELVNTGWRKR